MDEMKIIYKDKFISRRPVGKNGVFIRMRFGVKYTNVPHRCAYFSESGFTDDKLGLYDLALNILDVSLEALLYTGPRVNMTRGSVYTLAWKLHKQFVKEWLDPALWTPEEGQDEKQHTIAFSSIERWLTDRLPLNSSLLGAAPDDDDIISVRVELPKGTVRRLRAIAAGHGLRIGRGSHADWGSIRQLLKAVGDDELAVVSSTTSRS